MASNLLSAAAGVMGAATANSPSNSPIPLYSDPSNVTENYAQPHAAYQLTKK
jgi:hypothetical protein